jgi:hypothetical protein
VRVGLAAASHFCRPQRGQPPFEECRQMPTLEAASTILKGIVDGEAIAVQFRCSDATFQSSAFVCVGWGTGL